MKPMKTLVLLANDAMGRLFENLGPGEGLNEIEDFSAAIVGAEVRYSDRPGRSAGAGRVAQHAFFDQAEAEEEQSRDAFVRAVAEETDARFGDGGYDRFVVAAAPATLGVLRTHLSARLRKALVFDIDKDFMKEGRAGVAKHLSAHILL